LASRSAPHFPIVPILYPSLRLLAWVANLKDISSYVAWSKSISLEAAKNKLQPRWTWHLDGCRHARGVGKQSKGRESGLRDMDWFIKRSSGGSWASRTPQPVTWRAFKVLHVQGAQQNSWSGKSPSKPSLHT
jgi:hypothetical protein